MTEVKNTGKQQSSDNRISTHPSYKEYSWDALVGSQQRNKQPAQDTFAAGVLKTPHGAERGASGKRGVFKPVRGTKRFGADTTASEKTVPGTVSPRTAPSAVKEKKVKTKRKINIHTITTEKRYSFPVSIVLLALCFTLLIIAIVTTAVRINEITQVNADLESKYNAMVSQENELRLMLETRDDLRVVEQMAKEELGMVKVDQVERYYLTVHQEDKIEIIEETEEEKNGFFDGFSDFKDSIAERVRTFFGM